MQSCILWSTSTIFLHIVVLWWVPEIDKNNNQFFKKIHSRDKLVIRVQFDLKHQQLISHYVPYSKYFLRHCSITGHNRYTIVVLVNFGRKSSFKAKGEFGPNFAQNDLNLYLMICHRVFCWNIFTWWDTIDWRR